MEHRSTAQRKEFQPSFLFFPTTVGRLVVHFFSFPPATQRSSSVTEQREVRRFFSLPRVEQIVPGSGTRPLSNGLTEGRLAPLVARRKSAQDRSYVSLPSAAPARLFDEYARRVSFSLAIVYEQREANGNITIWIKGQSHGYLFSLPNSRNRWIQEWWGWSTRTLFWLEPVVASPCTGNVSRQNEMSSLLLSFYTISSNGRRWQRTNTTRFE